MSPSRCRLTKANGEQCGTTFGITAEGYCWHHCPTLEQERHEARAKGGKHAARGRHPWAGDDDVPGKGPQTAQEAQEWASWCIEYTARGLISEGVSRQLSTAIGVFLRAQEKANLEKRVAALEAKK